MGIINEEIYTGLGGMAIKYYENLGYKIPKNPNKQGNLTVSKGTKIKVKVSDLTNNSSEYIDVECDECKKKYKMQYSKYNKNNIDGKIYCKKCANKVLNGGENNYAWDENKTQEERENGRKIEGYTDFIKKVLMRDNYVCKCCGDENNTDLEVHHLDGYDWCEEKRTDETNGITLCKTCHKNFHLIYGYGDNTKQQFENWIGRAIKLLKYGGDLPTTRKIYCIEEDKVYDSVIDLKDKWNIKSKSSIYEVCNHKIKKDKKGSFYKCNSIKGKHLLYLDEYLSMDKISYSIKEEYSIADKEQDLIILEAERLTLKDMEYESIGQVIRDGKIKDFYTSVYRIIQSKANIKYYFNAYQIKFNKDLIIDALEVYGEDLNHIRVQLNNKVKEKLFDNAIKRQEKVENEIKEVIGIPRLKNNQKLRIEKDYLDNIQLLINTVINMTSKDIRNKLKVD